VAEHQPVQQRRRVEVQQVRRGQIAVRLLEHLQVAGELEGEPIRV